MAETFSDNSSDSAAEISGSNNTATVGFKPQSGWYYSTSFASAWCNGFHDGFCFNIILLLLNYLFFTYFAIEV